jgi:hypothetical protein
VLASIGDNKFGDPIHVEGKISETSNWPNVDVPIVVAGTLHIAGDKSAAILTIAKNTVVQFDSEGMIDVGNEKGGGLVADTVKFTSANASKAEGDWKGIRFGNDVSGTKITNCTIEYAGKDFYGSAAIMWDDKDKIKTDKNVKIEHCSFAHNAGGAFYGPKKDCGTFDDPPAGNKSDGSPLCVSTDK